MPLEGQTGICLRHATAIVNDLDRRTPGIDHHHPNVVGTGINGVLNQLLDNRCWPLDDLASRNLVGYGIGKKLYFICHNRTLT